MKKITLLTLSGLLVACLSSGVMAKLPALTPEAKEAAELAKAKAAHGDKKAAYALCNAQNKVARSYAVKDKVVTTPECADPGEFKPPVAADAAPKKPPEVAAVTPKAPEAPKK
jgi:hypothetical protein